MSETAPQIAAPGFYSDENGRRRFWDGSTWTEHIDGELADGPAGRIYKYAARSVAIAIVAFAVIGAAVTGIVAQVAVLTDGDQIVLFFTGGLIGAGVFLAVSTLKFRMRGL